MRKMLSLIITLMLIVTLCACGSTAQEAPESTDLAETQGLSSLGTRSLGASGGAGLTGERRNTISEN